MRSGDVVTHDNIIRRDWRTYKPIGDQMNDLLLLISILGILFLISAFIFQKARRLVPYLQLGAKVSAWEANLLSEARLDELNEAPEIEQIFTALEDTQYQPYIGDISLEGEIDVVETEESFNSFLRDRYAELLEIVPEEREDVVRDVIGIVDVRNLKGIMTGISEDLTEEKIENMLIPSPTLPEDKLEMLLSAESLDRLLEYLKGSPYHGPLSEALEERYDEEGIPSLIRALDKTYHKNLWRAVKEKKAQRSVLEKIIGTKLDIINIKLILRLKKEETHPERIGDFLVPPYQLSDEQIKDMTVAEDTSSASEIIMDTVYGLAVQEGITQFEETDSLFALEKRLEEEFLRICRGISLGQPFTLAPTLTYIFLTKNEVRNLRTISRLKAEGVEPDEIENNLTRRLEI